MPGLRSSPCAIRASRHRSPRSREMRSGDRLRSRSPDVIFDLLHSNRTRVRMLLETNRSRSMTDRSDVKQGTLALMVLKTLEAMGPLHGYGIARRIEQTSGQLLARINYGTLYPALLKARTGG